MSADRHSQRITRGRARHRTAKTTLWASAMLGPLALASNAAFGQADSLALSDDTPLDEDAGIRVPAGFDAKVFADDLGRARHVAVRDNGDVYVALRERAEGGGIVALRDEDGDGAAERTEYFGEHAGTGMAIHEGFLYASSDSAIYRYPLPEGDALVPESGPETVVEGFPEQRSHASKAFAFDDSGNLYVNVGAPSNACQGEDRTLGSPGQEPCPLLDDHAGIRRFDASKTDQTFADGQRFLTGTRNIVALDWNPEAGALYFAMHGRDQLHDLFPDLYTVEQSAELPAEELHAAREGADYGWPYTYWDHQAGARIVGPEYGGDGETVAEEEYQVPLLTFPGHWAPNDLLFYTAEGFPAEAQGGAFIAFHGSWNRAPLPQRGYNVVFVPFEGAEPAGDWSVFADGFTGAEVLADSDDAEHRPMGLAQGPDGALYITDSVRGRVWRVTHEG